MAMMTYNSNDDDGYNNNSDCLPVWTIVDDKEIITTGYNYLSCIITATSLLPPPSSLLRSSVASWLGMS